jgi:Uma2 family endonuclease
MSQSLLRGSSHPASLQIDNRVVLRDVPWEVYQGLQAAKGESSVIRAHYLHGQLELMSPSEDHELVKHLFDRLLAIWTLVTRTDLIPFGSWTVRSKAARRAAEADICYVLGTRRKKRPDLAIEIVWTAGGLNKLEVWRGLRVPEVWFWRKGVIEVYALRQGQYVRLERSALLAALDLNLLARHIREGSQVEILTSYQRALRRGTAASSNPLARKARVRG